jgi:hypothetical protein
VKSVPADRAKSKADELWLRTAHPLGKRKLKGLLGKGEILVLPAA